MFEVASHFKIFPFDPIFNKISKNKLLWMYLLIKHKEYLENKKWAELIKVLATAINPTSYSYFSKEPDRKLYNPYFEKDIEEIKKEIEKDIENAKKKLEKK